MKFSANTLCKAFSATRWKSNRFPLAKALEFTRQNAREERSGCHPRSWQSPRCLDSSRPGSRMRPADRTRSRLTASEHSRCPSFASRPRRRDARTGLSGYPHCPAVPFLLVAPIRASLRLWACQPVARLPSHLPLLPRRCHRSNTDNLRRLAGARCHSCFRLRLLRCR